MKQARINVMRFFKTFLGNQPKDESLSTIFKPLNEIEGKVMIRRDVLKDKVIQLQDEQIKLDDQIDVYEKEIKKCDQYLNSIHNFT